ncbi:MAG: PSD1 and planctomycete cytochrome C domain-containing protein [Planctomycetaceae bacterium]
MRDSSIEIGWGTQLRQLALISSLLSVTLAGLSIATAQETTNELAVSLESQVQPILKRHCFKCHGVSKKEGQLQLHSAVRIWKGGENGLAVVPSDPSQSLLWTRVEQDEMPPDTPLSGPEKKILHDWIAQGAKGLPASNAEAELMQQDEHWAFTRLRTVEPPAVAAPDTCHTPIDQFVQAELQKAGLGMSAETDRRTLIRRISFTLTGLPPTPDEITSFLEDTGDDAVVALIDHYLASPQYGIRWGRHWLDAAGYADSNGYFNADSDRPLAYRYRDYVVRSINADKPFDRFVREQIAGDEMAGFIPEQHRHSATSEMIDMLIATHYLRNGQDGSGESDGNPDEVRIDRYTALESSQQIIASSLLGLTFQCAKCHDHKFEPLTQADFYQFQSVLFPAYNPEKWVKPNDRYTFASQSGEYETWQAKIAAAKSRLSELQAEYRQWVQQNRRPDFVLFETDFADDQRFLEQWSNRIPGDDGPAGVAAVTILTGAETTATSLPAALCAEEQLRIIEGGPSGDKWLSTQQTFDWTPDAEGQWIQASFALLDHRVYDSESPAARIAYGIALHDFDNNSSTPGGNILIDGNPSGGAVVHVDYPGSTSRHAGSIGLEGYVPGHSFGVRVTHTSDHKFRLQHLVDDLPEGPHVDLLAEDLPNGSFGFAYCCGRSFRVDNVVIETSNAPPAADTPGQQSEVEAYRSEQQRRQVEIKAVADEIPKLQAAEPGRIAWVTDATAEPPDVSLLERGEYSHPREKVQPAPISALDDEHNPMPISRLSGNFPSTGRRLAWANWVTKPDSRAASLMARVQVNRIWQHHFGTGLVSTSENLGMSGAEPSNQALLDWLAQEFIKSGWSLKFMHRLILRSAVYRQSSVATLSGSGIDPSNRLLWRFPMRRLDAEAIRDAQLAISGELDLTMEGPYVATTRNGAAEVIVPEDRPGAFRRSIYLQQRRSQGLSMLNVFDAPMMVLNCTRRPVTTMPLQSLSLLNSEFTVKRGQSFAQRIAREAGDSAEARIRRAFVLAVGRECDSEELNDALQFVRDQEESYTHEINSVEDRAWSDFCQLLLASNPCLYLE